MTDIKDILVTFNSDESDLIIISDQFGIGSQYENGARRFIFSRPKYFSDDNMILFFNNGKKDFIPVSIGTVDVFAIPDSLTQTEILRLQIAFERNGNIIIRSNILLFSLRKSLNGDHAQTVEWPNPALNGLVKAAMCTAAYDEGMLTFFDLSGAQLQQLDISQSVQVGEVETTTLPYGQAASVTVEPEDGAFSFHFAIPEGKRGEKGEAGQQGVPGAQGPDGLTVSVNGIAQSNGNISLTAAEIPCPDFELDGEMHVESGMIRLRDTKAEHTSPNLWRPENFTFPHVRHGVTIDYNPDSEIYTLNGTATQAFDINISPLRLPSILAAGQKITLSRYYVSGTIEIEGNEGNVLNSYTRTYDSDSLTVRSLLTYSNINNYMEISTSSLTPTETEADRAISMAFATHFYFGTTFSNYQYKIQLEVGERTTWRPHMSLTVLARNVEGKLDKSTVLPLSDNAQDIGSAVARYRDLYATGTIKSSDERNKKQIEPLDEDAYKFLQALRPVRYRYIDGSSNSPHYGLIAQEVEDAMNRCGIGDFAGLIKTPIYAAERQEDADECIQADVERQIVDYIYGLRYDELIAVIIKTIQIQEERLQAVESGRNIA